VGVWRWTTRDSVRGSPIQLGPPENRVGADASPDDVRLARSNLYAVFEGRTAVRCPGHLPHATMALHPLDAQTRMEALAPIGDVSDELHKRLAERSLLSRGRRSQSRQNDARTSRVGIERLRPLVQGC
jgi:hypothetical protein